MARTEVKKAAGAQLTQKVQLQKESLGSLLLNLNQKGKKFIRHFLHISYSSSDYLEVP